MNPTINRRPSKACYDLWREFEGLKLKAYYCPAGILTIGRGHTSHVRSGQTCTEAQADRWMVEDALEAAKVVCKTVTVPLSQKQFDAMVLFVANVKREPYLDSTLLRKLNAGDYRGAAAEFPKWKFANKRVVGGLYKRRMKEQALFLEGTNDPSDEGNLVQTLPSQGVEAN